MGGLALRLAEARLEQLAALPCSLPASLADRAPLFRRLGSGRLLIAAAEDGDGFPLFAGIRCGRELAGSGVLYRSGPMLAALPDREARFPAGSTAAPSEPFLACSACSTYTQDGKGLSILTRASTCEGAACSGEGCGVEQSSRRAHP